MSRPSDSWAHVGATLSRLLAEPAPGWLSADTRDAARQLLQGLAADARDATVHLPPHDAAGELGISRAALYRARDGWLARR